MMPAAVLYWPAASITVSPSGNRGVTTLSTKSFHCAGVTTPSEYSPPKYSVSTTVDRSPVRQLTYDPDAHAVASTHVRSTAYARLTSGLALPASRTTSRPSFSAHR